MFDGVPDQFHQFIASSASAAARISIATTTLPLPLSFPPLHHASNSNTSFPPPPPPSAAAAAAAFDPLFNNLQPHHHHFLHPLHHQSHTHKSQNKETHEMVAMSIQSTEERARSVPEVIDDPWSNDEVLALLRIRSSMENWFPEFTWEHVSRKLAELGFKRTAEKCKEKFEEESRYFNNINYNKNFRIFSELEELCHGDHHHLHHQNQNNPQQPQQLVANSIIAADEKNKTLEKPKEDTDKMGQNLEEDSRNEQEEDNEKDQKSKKKRKRQNKKFEMFKGFCEDVVSRLLSRQEELHNKLLEDMVKRDEEKAAREEAWKKQEMDRINKELELRAQEQAIEGDRQATIIKFLTKFASPNSKRHEEDNGVHHQLIPSNANSNSPTSSSLATSQSPNTNPTISNQNKADKISPFSTNQNKPGSLTESQNVASENPSSPLAPTTPKVLASSPLALAPQNPNSLDTSTPLAPNSLKPTQNPKSHDHNNKEDLGKRWPRDEVLALINLRCNLYNNNADDHHHKEGAGAAAAIKAPLWERISQRMLELGYKRSAKRCKEKWENINKYFRKTKDTNKKRSLDSRTCPYFHQLSTLYNQGTLVTPSEEPGHCSGNSPETDKVASNSAMHNAADGEKNMVEVPVPAFDFEF